MSSKDDLRKQRKLQRLWVELEWRRCAQDESYFLSNYVYIPSLEDPRGRVKFELFDYQEELLERMSSNRFIIALKARQIGFTTLGMAHSLWLALFRPGAKILVVSKSQDSSNKNLAQARLAYQFLPEWMKERAPRLTSDSSKGMSFLFNDGMISEMKAAAATAGVFAGETGHFVLWDEAALVEPASLQEDVLRTLLPCTDAGGSMMIISTSRGAHNRFAKTYRLAKRNESQFVPFFKPWMVSPFMRCSRDCGWCGGEKGVLTPCLSKYDGKRRDFASEPWRFYSEYPENEEEAFRESGRPRFTNLPSEELYQEMPLRGFMVAGPDGNPVFVPDTEGHLHLASAEQDPTAFYVIAADPAQGIGKDYSAAHILCMTEDNLPEIVGYYHSNTVHPAEFAADLDRIGRYFSGREWAAKLGVENQGGQGELVINELHRHLDYPNPYQHQVYGSRRSRAVRMFAFPMTADRRKAVIDRLAKYLVVDADGEMPLQGLYPALRAELGQFVAQELPNGNIRYSADVGCHDDLVMSIAIGLWILIEDYEESSPTAAPIEERVWGTPATLNLNAVRAGIDAERERLQLEESNMQAEWDIARQLIHLPGRH